MANNVFLVSSVLLLVVVAASAQFTNVCVSSTQLTVDQGKVASLAASLVSNPYLSVSNAKFIGNCTCAGTVTLPKTHAMGHLISGKAAIFSSGQASAIMKEKNEFEAYTGSIRPVGPSDSDIAALVTVDEYDTVPIVRDACGITFDLILPNPVGYGTADDKFAIMFPYIFASEEYPEYVNQGKSDEFAFFMGTEKLNVATITDPITFDIIDVTIDEINNGINSLYFNDNAIPESGPAPFKTEFDGFTDRLSTEPYFIPVGTVVPVKIIVADVGDNRLDSAVIVELGSSLCGDKQVESGEECDNGLKDVQFCSNTCVVPKCGDKIVQAWLGETCDHGHDTLKCQNCTTTGHIWGDPHVNTFDGAEFMFNGWADGVFNMLSHSSYQINTFFRRYPKQDPTKTWIGAVGMRLGANDEVEITGAGKGRMTVKVNGEEMPINSDVSVGASTIVFKTDTDKDESVVITTPDMVVSVVIDSYNWNLDFGIDQISADMGDMHGVLGQSYKRMLAQKSAISSGKPVPHAVQGVEGTDADYFVASGLFGSDFKYNKFQAVEISADESAKKVAGAASSRRRALSTRLLRVNAYAVA